MRQSPLLGMCLTFIRSRRIEMSGRYAQEKGSQLVYLAFWQADVGASVQFINMRESQAVSQHEKYLCSQAIEQIKDCIGIYEKQHVKPLVRRHMLDKDLSKV